MTLRYAREPYSLSIRPRDTKYARRDFPLCVGRESTLLKLYEEDRELTIDEVCELSGGSRGTHLLFLWSLHEDKLIDIRSECAPNSKWRKTLYFVITEEGKKEAEKLNRRCRDINLT